MQRARCTHLRKEPHAVEDDESPDELDGRRDTPCRMAVAVLGRVVDDGREQQTDGDGPLVAGDDGATDPFRCALGLVHGHEGGDETDTETGEDTADDEGRNVVGTGLEGDTEAEDEAGELDTVTTTEDIGDGSAEEGTCQAGVIKLGLEQMNALRTHRRRYPRRGWRRPGTGGRRGCSSRPCSCWC